MPQPVRANRPHVAEREDTTAAAKPRATGTPSRSPALRWKEAAVPVGVQRLVAGRRKNPKSTPIPLRPDQKRLATFQKAVARFVRDLEKLGLPTQWIRSITAKAKVDEFLPEGGTTSGTHHSHFAGGLKKTKEDDLKSRPVQNHHFGFKKSHLLSGNRTTLVHELFHGFFEERVDSAGYAALRRASGKLLADNGFDLKAIDPAEHTKIVDEMAAFYATSAFLAVVGELEYLQGRLAREGDLDIKQLQPNVKALATRIGHAASNAKGYAVFRRLAPGQQVPPELVKLVNGLVREMLGMSRGGSLDYADLVAHVRAMRNGSGSNTEDYQCGKAPTPQSLRSLD